MSSHTLRYGIPKLLRVHFACVGHADARLDPLTLPFYRDAGMGLEPVHSTIWAENGVGKTSIRSLLFSILQPDINHVMKSASASGEKREYCHFFRGHDHAIILMEWVFDDIHGRLPGMENAGAPRRIIGMTANWPSRAADLAAENRSLGDLNRTYFSFTPNQGVSWNMLPVKGLAGGADHCKTTKEFLDWLRTHRQSIDLKTCEVHGEWREHLESLGLDPKLFDNQLNMHGSGGAIRLLKNRIRTSRDFVRFYLECALPEEIGQDLVELVLQDRKIILEKDKHHAGLEYLRVIQPPLDAFAATVDVYRAARSAAERSKEDTGRRLGLLDALEVHVAEDIRRTEEERKNTSAQQQEREGECGRLKVYQQALEYQTARRELEERQERLVAAKQQVDATERYGSLMEAHGKWLGVKEAEDRLAPIEEQCQKLEAEEQELLTDARNAGATYLARLQEINDDLARQRSGVQNDLVRIQKRLDALDEDQKALLKKQARLEAEIETLQGKEAAARAVRANLVQSGILERDEDPRQGHKRHVAARTEADRRVTAQTATVGELSDKLLKLEAQRQPLDEERTRAVQSLRAAEAAQAENQVEKERLRARPSLCWALDTNDLALADEGILEAVAAAIQNRSAQRDDLSLKLADLKRRLFPLADVENGLLAPPGDTEKARVAMLALGINVFTAGSWLDNFDPETARRAIAADPARYTGLMVFTQAEMDDIRAQGGSITGLDHPVMVSIASMEDNPAAIPDRLVLLPEHPATFNRKEAKELAERLRCEVASQEEVLGFTDRELECARRDFGALEQFLGRFSKGDLGTLDEAVADANLALNDCERRVLASQEAIAAATQELADGRKELEQRNEEAVAFRSQEQQTHDWLLQFKDTLDSQRLPQAQKEIAVVLEKTQRNQEEAEPLKRDGEDRRNRAAEMTAQIRTNETANNEIPEDHRKGAVMDWSLTRARVAYSDANRRLEQSHTDQSQALFAHRQERREAVAKAQQELQRFCHANNVDPGDPAELKLSISFEEASVQAVRDLEERKKQHNIAEHDVELAREVVNRHATPAGYQKHRDDEEPRDAAHGRELISRTEGRISTEEKAILEAKEALHTFECRKLILQGQINDVTKLRGDWQNETDSISVPWTAEELPDTDEAVQASRAALGSHRSANRRFRTATEARDGAYRAVEEESRSRKWDAVDADKRRAVQRGADSLTEIIEALQHEYGTWRDVITDSLKRAEEAVGQITDRLTTLVKTDGLALINHAQTGSRLPDDIGDWSRRPFLKIELSGADTRNLSAADIAPYCNHVVRQLLSEDTPFDGRELIIRVLDHLAGAGGYKVTILKPSHTLVVDRHAITELASWSDGEIITVAILLYCCVVQARTWHRTGASRSTRPQSNGILLLDNPFGEANSPNFVQLQVDMAQKLGVQLIYTASGDPRELLAMFRRNNRLYQRRGKGLKHVGVEDANLDGITVGRGTLGLKHV
jgi:hypothetical protein